MAPFKQGHERWVIMKAKLSVEYIIVDYIVPVGPILKWGFQRNSPFNPTKEIGQEMRRKKCDWWSVSEETMLWTRCGQRERVSDRRRRHSLESRAARLI